MDSLRRKEWSKTWLFNDYVVFYVSQVQRELPDAELVSFFKNREPEYTARIGGVDFAWVYESPLLLSGAPPAMTRQVWAVFGDEIALSGYSLGETALAPGRSWDLTLHWEAQRPPTANYQVSLRLVDQADQVAWETTWRPFEDYHPTGLWQVGRTEYDRQSLALPESLIPGQTYCLQVQLFDAVAGAPLRLAEGGQGDWFTLTCLPAAAQ